MEIFRIPLIDLIVWKVEFVKGRFTFGDAKKSTPFPSMVAVFKPCDDPSIHHYRSGRVN